ncbi:MAG: SUMF1/EgtB/PvdO family nonheme iron enzyme [Bacteroidota bacterium]
MKYHRLFLLISVWCCLSQCYPSQRTQGTTDLPKAERRYVPEDLIFVAGDGVIAPFYVSIQEESNAHYRLYLQWLQDVYGDSYPEVYAAALPKYVPDHPAYNDPMMGQQLTHPALAEYPVVGLTWLQVQDYLRWKTDRLNEAVLIQRGYLNANFHQKDEDTFNTEAFLFEQYQGSVRKGIPDEQYGERPVLFTDGYLFAGFRLPTEAEWDYLDNERFWKPKRKPRIRRTEPLPYADNHYLRLANWSSKPLYSAADTLPFLAVDNGHSRPINYARRDYGILGLHCGVREWVVDEYQAQAAPAVHWTQVMENSGFPKGGLLVDETGVPEEKNHLGHLNNARWYGTDADGHALFYSNYELSTSPRQRVVKGGTWETPSSERRAQLETEGDALTGFRTVIAYYPKDHLQWDWPTFYDSD